MDTIVIVGFAVILLFFALTVLALAWQKKALTNQQAALSSLSSVDESIEISHSALQQQKEYEAKMDLYICNQKRMIELLEKLVEQLKK